MATKLVHVFAFRSARSGIRSALGSGVAPLKALGHIGISLDGGKTIYGFQPIIPDGSSPKVYLKELVLGRKTFQGKVSNDTAIFKEMHQSKAPDQEVVVVSEKVTDSQWTDIKTKLFDSHQPDYGFSKSIGLNCGAYIARHLNLNSVDKAGLVENVVDEMVKKGGGKEWDGTEQKE